MNEQEIRNLIRQEIQAASSERRFQLSPVPQHRHSGGADGSPVFRPYQLFAGFVPYDGDLAGILEVILPRGWGVTYNGTGDYTLTHNLGTALYSFVAVPNQSTNQVVSPVVETFKNEVAVGWFDSAGARQDTSFNFVLMLLAGTVGEAAVYATRNVPNT